MDNISAPFFTAELGKDIAKSALISAASMVACLGGLIAVAVVIGKVEQRKLNAQKTPVTQ